MSRGKHDRPKYADIRNGGNLPAETTVTAHTWLIIAAGAFWICILGPSAVSGLEWLLAGIDCTSCGD
ncbi:hypothetical protein EU805_01625 [Salipiger sp. IMCC34102]|uniref:hypothetical protein n=1 Tax=Salipiger sp. IMCC34102 TaxID=2510647 RepID=UPI00101C04AD|nr:hypothetical protein [Salipiger sp. IMCC34102]RYH04097.1 hypothetical protein EU805_01625 [Salipiger sp. IMCC34102]